jgi:cytochrome P450
LTSLTAPLPDVDLSSDAFWELPLSEREAVFTALRHVAGFPFYEEPDLPFIEKGPGYRVVTRHADIDHISRDPERFCSGRGAVSIADMPEDLQEFYGSMISMDDPRHFKIRRLVSAAFTPRMLESLVSDVELLADELLTEARTKAAAGDGTFDLVAEISTPLPLRVICKLMGVPPEDQDLVLRMSNIILSGGDPELVGTPEEALGLFLDAGMKLSELMGKLAAERQTNPTDDLTSALVSTEVEGDSLTHQEIASFFILLCVAGHETTRNAITAGVLALHDFPEQKARWMADPALTKTAVEEIVRWASPVNWMRRTATVDTTVNGTEVKAGDKLLLFYGSANRDETAFDAPFSLDVGRSPNPHMGFGAAGPHFCLGSHLARREITVVFRKLFELMPDLEVVGPPDRLRASFVNAIKRLPVRVG